MAFALSDISKNHQVRKKYTIQLGENELVLKVTFCLDCAFSIFCLVTGKTRSSLVMNFT